MNDDDLQERDLGTGTQVEDSRGYSSDEQDEGILDKVKNAIAGDNSTDDDEDEDGDAEDHIESAVDDHPDDVGMLGQDDGPGWSEEPERRSDDAEKRN